LELAGGKEKRLEQEEEEEERAEGGREKSDREITKFRLTVPAMIK
jgi:hypothetical protein